MGANGVSDHVEKGRLASTDVALDAERDTICNFRRAHQRGRQPLHMIGDGLAVMLDFDANVVLQPRADPG